MHSESSSLQRADSTRSVRAIAYKRLENWTDAFISVVIVLNVVILVLEADENAKCSDDLTCRSQALAVANFVILALFTMEIGIKLHIHRCDFFKDRFRVADSVIVMFGYLTVVLETFMHSSNSSRPIQMLRMLRIFKALRAVRIIKVFPELSLLMQGFISAFSAMIWGIVLIAILILFFGIVTVDYVHPMNVEIYDGGSLEPANDWCPEAFGSVFNATLTYFQTLVAGDSWGTCILPLVNRQPWILVFFASSLVCVQLGFTNLILAVVVEKAAAQREADRVRMIEEKQDAQKQAIDRLRLVFKKMDKDESGELTFEELMAGYDNSSNVKQLFDFLDYDRDDLVKLFQLMDTDGSGTLSYLEFITNLKKAEFRDWRPQSLMTSLAVDKLLKELSMRITSSDDQAMGPQATLGEQHAAGSDDVAPSRSYKKSVRSQRTTAARLSTTNDIAMLEAKLVARHEEIICALRDMELRFKEPPVPSTTSVSVSMVPDEGPGGFVPDGVISVFANASKHGSDAQRPIPTEERLQKKLAIGLDSRPDMQTLNEHGSSTLDEVVPKSKQAAASGICVASSDAHARQSTSAKNA